MVSAPVRQGAVPLSVQETPRDSRWFGTRPYPAKPFTNSIGTSAGRAGPGSPDEPLWLGSVFSQYHLGDCLSAAVRRSDEPLASLALVGQRTSAPGPNLVSQ